MVDPGGRLLLPSSWPPYAGGRGLGIVHRRASTTAPVGETIELEAGHDYQFRYLIDGTRWVNDTQADKFTYSGVAAEQNSVIAL